jgi:hypothetical protein
MTSVRFSWYSMPLLSYSQASIPCQPFNESLVTFGRGTKVLYLWSPDDSYRIACWIWYPPQSRRTVTLSSSFVEPFEAYSTDRELIRIKLSASLNADDIVFIRSDGSPTSPDTVTLAVGRIIKRAGLKDIRIHDLTYNQG